MIRFSCKNCGQKLKIDETFEGKKIRCPKCKNAITVPKAQPPKPAQAQKASKKDSKITGYELTLLDAPNDKVQTQAISQSLNSIQQNQTELEQESTTEETEIPGKRTLPWIIDIFLYPVSQSGLINLAIFVGAPFIIRIIQILLGPFALAVAFPGFIIKILVGLYAIWYIAECVRDSAKGGVRAPMAFASADIGEMFSQSLSLGACYILFFGPVFFYSLYTHKTDIVYWLLLVYAVQFFPIGLLAVIMFNSSAAFNPILWLISILRTFFRYCGLVLLTGTILLVIKAIRGIEPQGTQLSGVSTLLLGAILYGFTLYVTLITAHLLGRFYWQCKDRLNWGV